MLIELFGENYGCFRDRFHLSTIAADIEPQSRRGLVDVVIEGEDQPLRLLRSIAVYGANASGKSTVLRAASAMGELLLSSSGFASDDEIKQFEPFRLDSKSATKPVLLGVRGVISGRVYEYAFEYLQDKFVSEHLYDLTAGKKDMLFSRSHQRVRGLWTKHEQFKLITAAFRPNALLLSLAERVAPELAGGMAVGLRSVLGQYLDFTQARHSDPSDLRAAERVKGDKAFGEWLRARIRDADVGIVNYEFRKSVQLVRDEELGKHKVKAVDRLVFRHTGVGTEVVLPYSRESMGTRRLVQLAPAFYDLAHGQVGRTAWVDELDASMHPLLLGALVEHLNDEKQLSEVKGQLIFATHETSLIDGSARDATLRRDQVYFTEKGADGRARLYSLAEFKERDVVNLRKRYLEGRYGGLPSLGEFGE